MRGRISVHGASDAGHNNRNQGRAGTADEAFCREPKSQRSSAESTSFDGKRKDESADRRNSRTDGAEPGEKGKYLLMAGIAVLGIGLLFVLPPLGVAVLFASMVGNGLMHGRESKKLESALKAFGCILRLQRTARELGKEKISGLEMYQKRLEEQENNSVRLQENAEHL